MRKGKIVVITGKSASGKTVLTDSLMQELENVGTIQSTTTRKRRIGDTDVEYRFVSFLLFCWELITGQYVSWRKATKKLFRTDDFYSVRLDKLNQALASGKIFIRSLTPDTIARWHKVAGDRIIFIHLIAPDEMETRRRMIERGGMTTAQIDERIREEKKWDRDICIIKESGIPIHVSPAMSLDDVLKNTIRIIESYV